MQFAREDERVKDPSICLAVDNCFAKKRWTRPVDWMQLVRDCGLHYIEASADTECDPLYLGMDYLERWAGEVEAAEAKIGTEVVNLYSGHGTYSTLGLGHTDASVRERILSEWLKPMVELAAALDTGLGFSCHAFPEPVLQDPVRYERARGRVVSALGKVAEWHGGRTGRHVGVEQMYTPHQIPWTIDGARRLMQEVYARSSDPFYITIDTGHQSGQRRFRRPALRELQAALQVQRDSGVPTSMWVGPDASRRLALGRAAGATGAETCAREILAINTKYPYLFSNAIDSDTYAWLRELGPYSPIVHLQQTDGSHSSHWPFTPECNEKGIIDGLAVLRALASGFDAPVDRSLPPRVDRIYLTLEPFSGTTDYPHEIVARLEASVAYWRRFVPEDGMSLSSLVREESD